MSEELQSMVQILELYGKGLGALGRAIRFSAKGAAKGVSAAKVRTMQHKLKLHYASTGNHKTMKLADLEKLTGGQYNILNIPLEEEKELMGFYDRLKKMHVSFAELPDLQLGDGYTQIAYNPMDADNVKMVIQYYRKYLSEMPEDISIEKYMDMAGEDGRVLLDELAEKGYKDGMHIEQLAEIQSKVKDEKQIPFSLNMDTLLLREEKDAYVLRLPKSRMPSEEEHAIRISKRDCLLLDEGHTLVSCIEKSGKTNLYRLGADGQLTADKPLLMKNENLEKAFAPLSGQKKRQIEHLKAYQSSIFPSFNRGQERGTDSPAPDSALEQMAGILSAEQAKSRQADSRYIPVTFDKDTQVLAESANIYAVILPGTPEEGEDCLRCAIIGKSDAQLSEDGKTVTAYLDRDRDSLVMVFNGSEEKIREYRQKNDELAMSCLKRQEDSRQGVEPAREKSLKNPLGRETKAVDAAAKKVSEKGTVAGDIAKKTFRRGRP